MGEKEIGGVVVAFQDGRKDGEKSIPAKVKIKDGIEERTVSVWDEAAAQKLARLMGQEVVLLVRIKESGGKTYLNYVDLVRSGDALPPPLQPRRINGGPEHMDAGAKYKPEPNVEAMVECLKAAKNALLLVKDECGLGAWTSDNICSVASTFYIDMTKKENIEAMRRR